MRSVVHLPRWQELHVVLGINYLPSSRLCTAPGLGMGRAPGGGRSGAARCLQKGGTHFRVTVPMGGQQLQGNVMLSTEGRSELILPKGWDLRPSRLTSRVGGKRRGEGLGVTSATSEQLFLGH